LSILFRESSDGDLNVFSSRVKNLTPVIMAQIFGSDFFF